MSRALPRSWIAWLAAFSLLFGGLPMAAQGAAGMAPMAICSAAGTAPEQPPGIAAHCPACCGHSAPALAPPPAAASLRVAHDLLIRRLAPAAPSARVAAQPYRHARPRGPPRA